jgi:hypothetical protein
VWRLNWWNLGSDEKSSVGLPKGEGAVKEKAGKGQPVETPLATAAATTRPVSQPSKRPRSFAEAFAAAISPRPRAEAQSSKAAVVASPSQISPPAIMKNTSSSTSDRPKPKKSVSFDLPPLPNRPSGPGSASQVASTSSDTKARPIKDTVVERAIKDTVIERVPLPIRQLGPTPSNIQSRNSASNNLPQEAEADFEDESEVEEDDDEDEDFDVDDDDDDDEIHIDDALHQREIALEYHRRRHDISRADNRGSLSGEGFYEEDEEREVGVRAVLCFLFYFIF